MCIDMCIDMCMDMRVDMRVDMCVDMCIDMRVEMYTDMCIDTHVEVVGVGLRRHVEVVTSRIELALDVPDRISFWAKSQVSETVAYRPTTGEMWVQDDTHARVCVRAHAYTRTCARARAHTHTGHQV